VIPDHFLIILHLSSTDTRENQEIPCHTKLRVPPAVQWTRR
jgi:hypothetical protein